MTYKNKRKMKMRFLLYYYCNAGFAQLNNFSSIKNNG